MILQIAYPGCKVNSAPLFATGPKSFFFIPWRLSTAAAGNDSAAEHQSFAWLRGRAPGIEQDLMAVITVFLVDCVEFNTSRHVCNAMNQPDAWELGKPSCVCALRMSPAIQRQDNIEGRRSRGCHVEAHKLRLLPNSVATISSLPFPGMGDASALKSHSPHDLSCHVVRRGIGAVV